MTTAAATMAVTIAAGVVGFLAADHTLPDSCELRKVFTDFAPTEATGVKTGMSDRPQITAGPPRGVTSWHIGPSLEVILTNARADGWVVHTDQIFEASKSATIVRTPISAHISVLQNGDGSANIIRDEDSENFRRCGAAVIGGAIGLTALTLRRRRQRPPTAWVHHPFDPDTAGRLAQPSSAPRGCLAVEARSSDPTASLTVMVRASTAKAVERDRDDRRLAAQLLLGPAAAGVGQVVDQLLAVQAQDLRAARLAVRSRTVGLTAADVDRELNNRTLIVTWLNRGTLHLVRPEDYWWLQHLTTPQLASGNAKRLEQEGVSPSQADRGVAIIEAALAANGPMTRAQLREMVQAADVPVAGQAMVHILFLSALRGLTIRGPVVSREQAFVLVRDWLAKPPKVMDRDTALSELARRFLVGHGPANDRDLAKWAGITLGDARRGLRSVGAELEEQRAGLVDLAGRPPPSSRRRPKLLGGFDPLLHGWVDREPVLGGNQTIVTLNGIFRPFALAGGRAVATWSMQGGRVRLEPFDPLASGVLADLDREARDVERFLAPH